MGRTRSDEEIRAAILATYRAHQAAGLAEPKEKELFAACGTTATRVPRLRRAMKAAGELPELPMSRFQRGGMAAVRGSRAVGPRRATTVRPDVAGPEFSDCERLVEEHYRRERLIRQWGRRAARWIEQRERAVSSGG